MFRKRKYSNEEIIEICEAYLSGAKGAYHLSLFLFLFFEKLHIKYVNY